MADKVSANANNQLKSDGSTNKSGDNTSIHTLNPDTKRDCLVHNDDHSSTDSSEEHSSKKRHRKSDSHETSRLRELHSKDKKSKKKKRDRHEKKKKRYRNESDSTSDSDVSSDDEEVRRRRKRDRKKSKKEKKRSRHRRQEESNDNRNSTKDTATIRRSVITGEKLQLKIDKTAEDVVQEQARKQLLDFMNASYK